MSSTGGGGGFGGGGGGAAEPLRSQPVTNEALTRAFYRAVDREVAWGIRYRLALNVYGALLDHHPNYPCPEDVLQWNTAEEAVRQTDREHFPNDRTRMTIDHVVALVGRQPRARAAIASALNSGDRRPSWIDALTDAPAAARINVVAEFIFMWHRLRGGSPGPLLVPVQAFPAFPAARQDAQRPAAAHPPAHAVQTGPQLDAAQAGASAAEEAPAAEQQ